MASKRTTPTKKPTQKPTKKPAKKPTVKAVKKPTVKAAPKPAVKAEGKPAPKPTKGAKAPGGDVAAQVGELAKLLASYAPARMAKVSGAKSFAELEALVAVPPALRALWSWADGLGELLVMSPDDLGRAVDLFSVRQAARTVELDREADMPEDLVPFAGEPGSGDCYALDGSGRVVYWDHEEGAASPHAASLGAPLANTLAAIRANALFGGPERKAGEVDKKVLRLEQAIETDLRDAASVSLRFDSPAHKLREAIGKVKGDADRHRLSLRLRDRLRELRAPEELLKAVEESILYTALATASWEDGLASLAATGGVVGGRDNWYVLGLDALEAGELEVALRAFAGGDSTDSRLGEIAVARKLGRAPSRSLDAVAATITKRAKDIAARLPAKPSDFQLRDLVSALVERATVEMLRGDEAAARATLDEAYRHPLGDRFRDPVEANAIAGLAGLVPRR